MQVYITGAIGHRGYSQPSDSNLRPGHRLENQSLRGFVKSFSPLRSIPLLAISMACCLVAGALNCGENGGNKVQPSGSSQTSADSMGLGLKAQLSGRYLAAIHIEEGDWAATGPQQDVVLTFHVKEASEVKQFEGIVELHPAASFDQNASVFVPNNAFVTLPSNGVELVDDNKVRFGGASLAKPMEGDFDLGSLTLKTASGFTTIAQASIQVVFFSVGPSSMERDNYEADDLNMGVVVNQK